MAHAGLDFGDVVDNIFTANGAKNGVPGGTPAYAHTFTAGTAGTVVFSVPGATATPALGGTTPASLTGCAKRTPANPAPAASVACATAQTVGGTGAVNWIFTGSLAPGGTGQVVFQVKVD